MLSDRLIKMIENHADQLTLGAVEKLRTSPHTPSYQRLSRDDVYQRVYKVYHDLHRWLSEKTDDALHQWYDELGETRFNQGVPLSEVIWALILTKYYLRDYIRIYGLADSVLELHQQQELYHLLDYFFDRAVLHAALGYERTAAVYKEDHALASKH
ncbi:MAG: hypothetical protein ACRD22_09065 [Terriglobia bacterium]